MIVCVGKVRADYLTLSSKLETQTHSFFQKRLKGLEFLASIFSERSR